MSDYLLIDKTTELPLVSVAMLTYGHETYIKQAIESVLMQQTTFTVQLVIAEDFSPDNTRKIIQDYQSKFPDKIKLILQNKNIGAQQNNRDLFDNLTGKYIAALEGDDFWTDPLKLQKQIDFLEHNNDFAICFHKVNILHADGSVVPDYITKVPENYQERETLANNPNYIHTPSVVFRNIVKKEVRSIEFLKSPIGDYFLYLIASKYGKIGFISEIMATYRHGVGVYSNIDQLKKHTQELLLFVNLYSAEKDPNIKETFYKNILGYVKHLEIKVEEQEKNRYILHTRRHRFIEKLYRIFKS